MLFKTLVSGCAVALSMFSGSADAAVNVLINGFVSCSSCAVQLMNGHWRVSIDMTEYNHLSVVEVTGTDNDYIDYIAVRNDTPDTYKVLSVGGSLSHVLNIEPGIFTEFPGELWVAEVIAGQIGAVTAHSIGYLRATAQGGNVLGATQLPTGFPGGEGILSVISDHGSITVGVNASGAIGTIRAPEGSIGVSGVNRATISAGRFIGSITAEAVYADMSITGAAPDIDWIETTVGDFVGRLTCRKITGANAPGPYGLDIKGDLDADITHTAAMNTDWRIGGSFAAHRTIDLPAEGLTKQIIFVAGGSGDWDEDAHIELEGEELDNEPYYTNTAAAVGGGSAGLATFDIHHESCSPVEGGSAVGYGPSFLCQGEEDCCLLFSKAFIRMYGPVNLHATLPSVTVKKWSGTAWVAVGWTPTTTHPTSDHRVVEVKRANGFWEVGEYLIEPIAGRMTSDEVEGEPNVVDFDYTFELTYSCGSEQGFVAGGFDMNGDGRMTSADLTSWTGAPRDLNADGQANLTDFARLMRIVARFSN